VDRRRNRICAGIRRHRGAMEQADPIRPGFASNNGSAQSEMLMVVGSLRKTAPSFISAARIVLI